MKNGEGNLENRIPPMQLIKEGCLLELLPSRTCLSKARNDDDDDAADDDDDDDDDDQDDDDDDDDDDG